jgi:hypothetical protein
MGPSFDSREIGCTHIVLNWHSRLTCQCFSLQLGHAMTSANVTPPDLGTLCYRDLWVPPSPASSYSAVLRGH